MLIYLGCGAAGAFGLAMAMAVVGMPPAASAHGAFALGAMPLIFAAMGHFVPVLTRSRGAEKAVHRLPLVLQLAGGAVVGVLAGVLPGALLPGAASVALVASVAFLVWIFRRGQASLGTPHPGLAWYKAALACLILALLAILAGLLWPAAYPALRLAHLHLNTLGFIGLTAIGTLHVLMPTVLGQPDPLAAQRLRRQLPWAMAGVGASALAGVAPWITPLGVVLFGGVVAHTVTGWLRTWGWARLGADGAAASLLAAACGLLVVVASGLAHGLGLVAARPAVAGFFALFLLPLVTGALSQLVPVWRFPGVATPARAALRARLARFGALRAGLFLLGGGLLLAGIPAGAAVLAAALLLFVAALASGLARAPARQP